MSYVSKKCTLLWSLEICPLGAPYGLHGSIYCDGWSGSPSLWLQGLRGSNDSISLLMGGAGSLGCWVSGGPGAGANLLWVFWVLTRQAAWLRWFGGMLFACCCVRLFLGLLPQLWWVKAGPGVSGCKALGVEPGPRPSGGKGHVLVWLPPKGVFRQPTCWWMDRAAFQRTSACRLVSGSQFRR